jgi:hypothetical protein
MNTSNLSGGKGQPVCEADKLTAICELIIWKMCEPRRLTALWAFMTCYRDTFTFFFTSHPTHFNPENEGSMYVQNVGNAKHIHTV